MITIQQTGVPHLIVKEPPLRADWEKRLTQEVKVALQQMLLHFDPICLDLAPGKLAYHVFPPARVVLEGAGTGPEAELWRRGAHAGPLQNYTLFNHLKYFRFVVLADQPNPFLPAGGGTPAVEIALRRALLQIPVGNLAALPVRHSGFKTTILPPQGELDPQRSSYMIFMPRRIKTASRLIRWQNVCTALADDATASLRIQLCPVRLQPHALDHLARMLGLLAQTPAGRYFEPNLAVPSYADLLNSGGGFLVTIKLSAQEPDRLLDAFLRDFDSQSFHRLAETGSGTVGEILAAIRASHLPRADWLCGFVEGQTQLYSLEEAIELIMPAYTMGDALAGMEHFLPSPFHTPTPTTGEANQILLGHSDGRPVFMAPEACARGMFISGIPGSGKSHTIQHTVKQVGVPVLLMDPVGHEHSEFFGARGFEVIDFKKTFCWGNPFLAAENMSLYSHAGLLTCPLSLFFPTTPVAKSYLQEMLLTTFRDKLQSLERRTDPRDLLITTGAHQRQNPEIIPTLTDFMNSSNQWLEREMSGGSEHGRDARDHFRVRFNLLRGSIFEVLCSGDPLQGLERYFNQNCVVELRNIMNEEEANAIFALFVSLSYAYWSSKGLSKQLRCLGVYEELHRIAPREAQGSEGLVTTPALESSKLIARIVSESRKFGMGSILCNQSASKVTRDILINCSSHIVHRTLDGPDKTALAEALGLSEMEKRYLGYLPRGEALCFLPEAYEALSLRVPAL